MNVTQAELCATAVKPDQFPQDALPEIALAGRSNVGKSTLINRLINRKNLARTSSRPGKTQTINFYCINRSLYLADMPGYGFARVSKALRASWGQMIERYLLERDTLKGVIQVIDLRHPPTNDDKQMFQWLQYHQLPTIVVATKADKISRGRWQAHLKRIRQDLGNLERLILFSGQTGQGKDELWEEIMQLVQR